MSSKNPTSIKSNKMSVNELIDETCDIVKDVLAEFEKKDISYRCINDSYEVKIIVTDKT